MYKYSNDWKGSKLRPHFSDFYFFSGFFPTLRVGISTFKNNHLQQNGFDHEFTLLNLMLYPSLGSKMYIYLTIYKEWCSFEIYNHHI
jgi:hypothetical protein